MVAGAIVLLAALAQLFLPGLAASRIRGRVERYGRVDSVSVEAWPAVKLLWGRADSVKVRARSLHVSSGQTARLLWEARDVNRLQATVLRANEGPLRLSDVSVVKHGSTVTAEARITAADVKAALPGGFGLQLISSEGGDVRVRASGGLFGVGGSVDAVAGASRGNLVVHPLAPPLRALQLTLFSDAHVHVEAVAARVEDGHPLSYDLTLRARLR